MALRLFSTHAIHPVIFAISDLTFYYNFHITPNCVLKLKHMHRHSADSGPWIHSVHTQEKCCCLLFNKPQVHMLAVFFLA